MHQVREILAQFKQLVLSEFLSYLSKNGIVTKISFTESILNEVEIELIQEISGYPALMQKLWDTFNEVKHLGLHVFQKESNTDGGEVAVSHLLVSQHPLEEPLQMGLRGLKSLTTPG